MSKPEAVETSEEASEDESYGTGLAIAYAFGALAVPQGYVFASFSSEAFVPGLTVGTLGLMLAPSVHWLNGEALRGFVSIGVQLIAPATWIGLIRIGGIDCHERVCPKEVLYGVAGGMLATGLYIAWAIVDVGEFSDRAPKRDRGALSFGLAPTNDGAVAFAIGRF